MVTNHWRSPRAELRTRQELFEVPQGEFQRQLLRLEPVYETGTIYFVLSIN